MTDFANAERPCWQPCQKGRLCVVKDQYAYFSAAFTAAKGILCLNIIIYKGRVVMVVPLDERKACWQPYQQGRL